jgi:hypothetical protein
MQSSTRKHIVNTLWHTQAVKHGLKVINTNKKKENKQLKVFSDEYRVVVAKGHKQALFVDTRSC